MSHLIFFTYWDAVLNVAENTLAFTHQNLVEPVVLWSVRTATFIFLVTRNSLILSGRRIVNIMLNVVQQYMFQEKVKFKIFFKTRKLLWILTFTESEIQLWWIWKFIVRIMQFFNHYSWSVMFFFWRVLIDDTDSKNWVQIVVKFSMEFDPKIFNQQ